MTTFTNILEWIGYTFDLHDLGQAYGLLCIFVIIFLIALVACATSSGKKAA